MNNKTELLTLQCINRECLSRVRLGHYQYSISVGALKYCPVCGTKLGMGAMQDDEDNYWEILGSSYGVDPQILKELYSIWDRKEHHRFKDFVSAMKKEAGVP